MNPLIRLIECESTNSEILNYLDNLSDGIVSLYTGNQTKGRGQYGNVWQSGKELNLSFSMAVCCKSISISDIAFNFHTAVLTREFIDKLSEEYVAIKWPNDLIMKNKKIAGLLVEKIKLNNREYYIFGVGINLLQVDFGTLTSAGSIYSQSGVKLEIDYFANEFHQYLSNHIFNANDKEILNSLNHFLFRKNKISVFEINNSRQNGIITKVDNDGFLEIELEKDGLKKFTYKEVKLLY
ncbi:MAG: biotin--[acetyl-CoA-carboxylase] ligase [Bacteroidetes bacterium]|jgi:BirA family biotin operon repressor/biotin-[acetyl-CoA-carboxylase] ligase|nr:biotin--[acetyl-CoA-carboxylase] ligase [Bacteroidota bacterium]